MELLFAALGIFLILFAVLFYASPEFADKYVRHSLKTLVWRKLFGEDKTHRLIRVFFAPLAVAFGAFLILLSVSPAFTDQHLFDEPIEGAYYTIIFDDNQFSVAKVLKVDDFGVHIRVYKNRFSEVPTENNLEDLAIGPHKEGEPLGIGHLPLTKNGFYSLAPKLIKKDVVVQDELEGYRTWLEGESRGYFGQ